MKCVLPNWLMSGLGPQTAIPYYIAAIGPLHILQYSFNNGIRVESVALKIKPKILKTHNEQDYLNFPLERHRMDNVLKYQINFKI